MYNWEELIETCKSCNKCDLGKIRKNVVLWE